MTKPRLVVDGRMVSDIPHGIARHVSELAKGLSMQQDKLPFEVLFLTEPKFTRILANEFQMPTVATHAKFLSAKELIEIPRVLKHLNASAFHSPSFASFICLPCPWAVTVHDLNHLYFGSAAKKFYYRTLLKSFVQNAAGVATVTEFAKHEIEAEFDLTNVAVVGNSIDELFEIENKKAEAPNARAYVLSFTAQKPHKNAAVLLQAFADYLEESKNPLQLKLFFDPLTLDVTSSFKIRLNSLITQNHIQLHAGTDWNQSVELVKNSHGVFTPSTYEGFGLPPLEAAVLGVPVVASNIAPHQEILSSVEKAVNWCRPQSVIDFKTAFHRAEKNQLLKLTDTQQTVLAEKYSRSEMVKRYLKFYGAAFDTSFAGSLAGSF